MEKEQKQLENLLLEICFLIQTGDIVIGATGLSENSANFTRDYYQKLLTAHGKDTLQNLP